MEFVKVLLLLAAIAKVSQARNKIIIIGMSGLRHDYVEKSGLPTFQRFRTEGVRATEMNIPMITNSWPSLWTLSTGLWPEEHGVIDDTMTDPTLQGSFHAGYTRPDVKWMPSKPIWISAEEAGVRTAVSGWPGAEIRYGSTRATNYTEFVTKETEEQTTVRLEKLANEMANGADLGLFLIPEPDNIAHKTGANSEQVHQALKANDRLLSHLLHYLSLNEINSTTNIIVVGDHGMTNHETDKVVYLSHHGIHLGDLSWFTGNIFTTGMLVPHDDVVEETYKKLSQRNATRFMKAYRRADLPEKFHLKNHRRTPPIVLVPELGYRIQITHPQTDAEQTRLTRGMHGYSNDEQDMKPAMLALGPDFKHMELEQINSIDIYPMVCSLLKLNTCHGTDGSMATGQKIVKVTLQDKRAKKLDYKSLNMGDKQKASRVVPSSSAPLAAAEMKIASAMAAMFVLRWI